MKPLRKELFLMFNLKKKNYRKKCIRVQYGIATMRRSHSAMFKILRMVLFYVHFNKKIKYKKFGLEIA